MRLVTTIMTISELLDSEIERIIQIFKSKFNNELEIYKYNYKDRKYHEVDIDVLNVVFIKDEIDDEIMKLILLYEEIMNSLAIDIDIIAANDDTETEVLTYERNNNNIKNFGLFMTKRKIPDIKPFYSSEICNAYVNLSHVSFGIYY